MTSKNNKKPDYKLFKQKIMLLFLQSPLRQSLSLLTLLIALTSALFLIYKQSPLMIVALVHLLPLLVVIRDYVRDKIVEIPPRWPMWLLGMVHGSVLMGTWGLFLSLYVDREVGSFFYTYSFILSSLAIFITLLPRLLSFISASLANTPYLGTYIKRITTPTSLYIALVQVTVVLLIHSNKLWSTLIAEVIELEFTGFYLLGILILFLLPTIIWRKLLWQKNYKRLFLNLLPHLSAWLFIFMFLVEILEPTLFFDTSSIKLIGIIASIISVLAIPYWTLHTLQGCLVKPLTQAVSERTDSIQSDTSDFIDVHGHSQRLVNSINRSSAGVFGVTGVRGAGKSALTRHVLAQLKEQYFVLEMTAPVRHDANLGFFISVCRSVCRKVLDGLDRILQGKQAGDTAQLKRRFRNALLTILVFMALISLMGHLSPTLGSKIISASELNPSQRPVVFQDPLLGNETDVLSTHIAVATERRIINSLLTQIDTLLNRQGKTEPGLKQPAHYLLLPLPDANSFFLALDHAPLDHKTLLNLHATMQNKESLRPVRFLDIKHQINQFICLSGNQEIREEFDYIDNFMIDHTKGGNSSDYCRHRSVLYGQDYFHTDIEVIVNTPSIKAPLALLHKEIRPYLFSQPETKNFNTDIQDDTTDQHKSQCEEFSNSDATLVSLVILEAFCHQDAMLSFDVDRLAKFRQLLRIYSRLLNGEITASSISLSVAAASKNSPETTYLPNMDLKSTSSLVFWSVIVLIILLLSVGPIWQGISSLARAMVNRRYLNLYHEAGNFIELLSYTSTEQNKRSFGFKGLSLGQSSTHVARDLTLPGLTSRYLAFIELIREQYNRKVIIVIDELDKIHDPDQVKDLLVEIKGALFNKGCFYLISISEDAARSFRYRLTSGRDIFESTFDEIIEIRQMDVQSGCKMLDKREQNTAAANKLPQECFALLVLFGGGIPREIVRRARTLSFEIDNMTLPLYGWTTRQLLQEEIANWISHFGETNLNGEETVKLRDHAQLAFKEVENLTPDYSVVSVKLQSCLEIIDPENLRKSVGFVVNHTNNGASMQQSNSEQLRYQTLASDIQACIRLIILSTIAELTEKTKNDWEQYDAAILACHHALADKPALTETLLQELRQEHGLNVIGDTFKYLGKVSIRDSIFSFQRPKCL